jgi:hypothetical protein
MIVSYCRDLWLMDQRTPALGKQVLCIRTRSQRCGFTEVDDSQPTNDSYFVLDFAELLLYSYLQSNVLIIEEGNSN